MSPLESAKALSESSRAIDEGFPATLAGDASLPCSEGFEVEPDLLMEEPPQFEVLLDTEPAPVYELLLEDEDAPIFAAECAEEPGPRTAAA